MIQQDSGHPHAQIHIMGRRAFLTSLAGAGLALAAHRTEPASGNSAALAASTTPVTDELSVPLGQTFVGPTLDPEPLVAIVLRDDAPGEIVAYLCRGPELNIWFTGRLQGDVLELTGAPPAIQGTPSGPVPVMSGYLTGEGVRGEARLQARTLGFTATPATGIAGLYVAERDSAGFVRGASSTGTTLRAQQVAAEGEAAAEAPYRIAGTVTLPDGQAVPIEIPAHTEAAAPFRWMALADGSVRGAGWRRRGGDGVGAVEQTIGL